MGDAMRTWQERLGARLYDRAYEGDRMASERDFASEVVGFLTEDTANFQDMVRDVLDFIWNEAGEDFWARQRAVGP